MPHLRASLFATYAVLGGNYAAGPAPADLFDLKLIAVATTILLVSSITYGVAMIRAESNAKGGTLFWLGITGLLGLEAYEFYHLIAEGAGPQWSAFLPSLARTDCTSPPGSSGSSYSWFRSRSLASLLRTIDG